MRETTSYFEAFIFEDSTNSVKDEREVDDRQIEELLSGLNDVRAEGCVGGVQLAVRSMMVMGSNRSWLHLDKFEYSCQPLNGPHPAVSLDVEN